MGINQRFFEVFRYVNNAQETCQGSMMVDGCRGEEKGRKKKALRTPR